MGKKNTVFYFSITQSAWVNSSNEHEQIIKVKGETLYINLQKWFHFKLKVRKRLKSLWNYFTFYLQIIFTFVPSNQPVESPIM